MTAANSAGRPSLTRWPTRFHLPRQAVPAAVATIAMAAGLLAIAPLVSLIVIAFGDTGKLWPHLSGSVSPAASGHAARRLAGVAIVTTVVGAGTAWSETTFASLG